MNARHRPFEWFEREQALALAELRDAGVTDIDIGRTYAHRLVAERVLGRPLVRGEIVHHRDERKTNNAPANLQAMTISEHMRHHALERARAFQ